MASRILNFENPPMVERSSLPERLQPQNRFWGKVRCYVNGQDPHEIREEYQAQQSESVQQMHSN